MARVLPISIADAFGLVDVAAEEIIGLMLLDEIAHRREPACRPGRIWSSAVP